MKIILDGYIFHNSPKKKAAITIDDDLILFNDSTIYSNPIAILKKGRLVRINKCKDDWCKIYTEEFKGWLPKKSIRESIEETTLWVHNYLVNKI